MAPPALADSHAEGEADASAVQEFFDYLREGTVKLDVRARWENARIDDLKVANAVTLRTRLGYGTRPWHGLSAYAELENLASPDTDAYHDAVGANTRGRTVVADAPVTEVNQAYGNFALPEISGVDTGSAVRGGRQRIVLDDARFIGNVGWRQNEQTYDAAQGTTSLGIEGLSALYAYLWEVKRIFGDQGASGAVTRDFGSDSHLVNVRYDGFDAAQVTAFAYLLDFNQHGAAGAPANNSHTYGFRANGALELAEGLRTVYAGSYAYQTDATINPVSYEAHYGAIDVALASSDWGSIGGGYEVLGSDDRGGQFRTPLATAHKFNGWADVFLDNGAAFGLRDAYGYIAPKLPCGFRGRLVFHQFWSDSGGTKRGTELDAVVSRRVFEYVTLLGKLAWYKGQNLNAFDGGRADAYRLWLQATFAF